MGQGLVTGRIVGAWVEPVWMGQYKCVVRPNSFIFTCISLSSSQFSRLSLYSLSFFVSSSPTEKGGGRRWPVVAARWPAVIDGGAAAKTPFFFNFLRFLLLFSSSFCFYTWNLQIITLYSQIYKKNKIKRRRYYLRVVWTAACEWTRRIHDRRVQFVWFESWLCVGVSLCLSSGFWFLQVIVVRFFGPLPLAVRSVFSVCRSLVFIASGLLLRVC